MNFLRHARKYIGVGVACIAVNSFGQSTITVNADGASTLVRHEIFGLLMERLGRNWGNGVWVGTNSTIPNTNGMRNDIIEGFKECGVGAVEWPGGCAAGSYDWSNNKNPANDVGVDRFIQFCKLTGAEAVIAGAGLSTSAASNLAFAQYILNTLNYPLKWFKVGNEVWGCGGNQSVSTYINSFKANYDRLKDLKTTAKDLSIVAAAGTMEGNTSWIPTFFSGMPNTFDGVEYHDYIYHPDDISGSNPTTANYWKIIKEVISSDFGSNINKVINAYNSADPNKKVKVVLDEWGDWLQDNGDGWMQTGTVMDAVSAGLHLNMMVAQADRIAVACLAQGVNVIHSIINTNQSTKAMVKTPTFFVFKMLKPHHVNNAKLAPITASKFETVSADGATINAINAVATIDDSKVLSISFANADLTTARKVTVTLTTSVNDYKVMSAEVVTGASHTTANDFGAAEAVTNKPLDASAYALNGKTLEVTLPSKSVVMVRLSSSTAINSANFNSGNKIFSVKNGARGTLQIGTPHTRSIPATIGLYRVDGKTLVRRVATVLQGNTVVDFGRDLQRAGVYIVKISGSGIDCSKRIVVAR
jgi:alpha-N-arabinofuranosidase